MSSTPVPPKHDVAALSFAIGHRLQRDAEGLV